MKGKIKKSSQVFYAWRGACGTSVVPLPTTAKCFAANATGVSRANSRYRLPKKMNSIPSNTSSKSMALARKLRSLK